MVKHPNRSNPDSSQRQNDETVDSYDASKTYRDVCGAGSLRAMPGCGPRTCRASNWVKLWLIAGDARLLESLRGSGCLPGILKLGPVHTLGRLLVNCGCRKNFFLSPR